MLRSNAILTASWTALLCCGLTLPDVILSDGCLRFLDGAEEVGCAERDGLLNNAFGAEGAALRSPDPEPAERSALVEPAIRERYCVNFLYLRAQDLCCDF